MKIVGGTLLTIMLAMVVLAKAIPELESSSVSHSAASGAELYARFCVTCHGRDGRARVSRGRSTRARNLADREWQDRVTDERIYNVITNGKGRMPGFAKKISEAEIDQLVQYVRSLKK